MHFHWHSVGQADPVTPETSSDRDQVQLSSDDAATDSCCHLLRALGTQTDVAVGVAHQDVAHKSVGLTGGGHLLHGVNLQHLVLQASRRVEVINDLRLLDGQGVQVDLLQVVDLIVVHEPSQLGHRNPLLLLLLSLALSFALALLAFALPFVSKASLAKPAFSSHVQEALARTTSKFTGQLRLLHEDQKVDC